MIKKSLALFLVFLTFNSLKSNQLTELYIDFDESMHRGFSDQEFNTMLNKKPQKNYLPILKALYQQSNFLTKLSLETPSTPIIPKIIHQIWLGSPLPERYKKFQATWKKFHPDWEYRLWTDADVQNFKLINQDAYNKSRNYAEKANIFRYEILDRLGGLYVDTDFECLRSFDVLNNFYEFYTGIATVNRFTLINNALIASIPGHPILKALIENLNKRDYGSLQMGTNGTIYFGHIIVETCQKNKSMDLSKIIILPATYVYPWPGKEAPNPVDNYFFKSFGIHYWDETWLKPAGKIRVAK